MTGARLLLKKVSSGATILLEGEMLVGRKPPAKLLLTEATTSKRHAQLTVTAEGVTVEDLNSSNGTFVNDRRIDGKVLLKSGDRLRFDLEEYEFLADPPVAADQTLMRPSAAPAAAATEAPREKPAPRPQAAPARKDSEPAQAERLRKLFPEQGNKTVFVDPQDIVKNAPGRMPSPRPIVGDDAAYLYVRSGASNGAQIRLARVRDGQQEWSVGSDPECEIRLNDSGVSGLHARIVNEGNKWKVIDVMSANGTWVNDKRSPVSYLQSGDRLKFGLVECEMHLPLPRKTDGRAGSQTATSVVNPSRKTSLAIAASFGATLLLLLLVYLLTR